jgi:excinuclease UvrABC nuclease subunit
VIRVFCDRVFCDSGILTTSRVYGFFTADKRLFYLSQSKNIAKRLKNHFDGATKEKKVLLSILAFKRFYF